MLELRSTCEHCNRRASPGSGRGAICSFECTFCSVLREGLLQGVCPNCGGGLRAPAGTAGAQSEGRQLPRQVPAARSSGIRRVDLAAHAAFVAALRRRPEGSTPGAARWPHEHDLAPAAASFGGGPAA
jgi:hypothetical protein